MSTFATRHPSAHRTFTSSSTALDRRAEGGGLEVDEELLLVRAAAPAVMDRSGIARGAAAPRLLALGARASESITVLAGALAALPPPSHRSTLAFPGPSVHLVDTSPAALAETQRQLARDPETKPLTTCVHLVPALEAGVSPGLIRAAPRGPLLATALGGALQSLAPDAARRLLRSLRKGMVRQDALLFGAGAAGTTAAELDADTAVAMCAAAGFRLGEQWTDHHPWALVLVLAD